MQQPLKVELGFVQRKLPWVIAGVAFVIYLATLNRFATFSGLINLARVVGWDWRPNLSSPLQYLLTFPVRYLSPGIQLGALNMIAAACAAGGLALLARCVALLPHDRTRDQRQLERSEHSLLSGKWAWAPPVLAAGICGLQWSFWENAVVGTGEALDLLVFAWLVHCLLMFRLDQRESRLGWFAFVYGVGVTNNYALIAFAPFFLGAMIWIRGLAFFNLRFLLRTVALGLLGLLCYLILPTLALGHETGQSWDMMLKAYWGVQRDNLVYFPRVIVGLLSLTSVLPVVFMGIRWPAQFGEVSPLGNTLTNLMTHLIHLVFLTVCAAVAFDQFFSPRILAGSLAMFLPFYFLGALSVGYSAGYFVLLGSVASIPNLPQWQRPSGLRLVLGRVLLAVILAAVVVLPALLAWQNLPRIWANTGSALSRFTSLAAKSLPAEGAIVLSDETFRLYAIEQELRLTGGREKFVLIDSRSLEHGSYHRYLLKKHPDVWPKEAEQLKLTDRVSQPELVQLLLRLAKTRPIYYLHPSFGYYFESFELRPKGLTYHLRPLTKTAISGPALTPAEVTEGVRFWEQVRKEELDRITTKIPPAEFPSAGSKNRGRQSTLEMYVGRAYALALNFFGVAVQQTGDLPKAVEYYDLAMKLDPYNASAMINAQYNRQFRAGKSEGIKPSDDVMKRFNMAGGSWDGVLGNFGPLEEPASGQSLAAVFALGNNPRQASQTMERIIHYNPADITNRIAQLSYLVRAGLTDIALARIAELRNDAGASKLGPLDRVNISVAEAWAEAVRNNTPKAVEILRDLQARHATESIIWTSLFDILNADRQPSNALAVAEAQIKLQPRNIQALVNTAVMKGQLGLTNEALALYNRAVEVDPKDEFALLNRGMLHKAMGNLDLALVDFLALYSGKSSASTRVLFELADIYFLKKSYRDARRHYKELLKKFPEGSAEHRFIRDRLRQID